MTADLQRRALASDLARRQQLASHDELRVLDRVLGRLELGRQRYGLLDLGKPRDWQRERFEERLDALVYDVCDELVLEDAARAGLREEARREMLGERSAARDDITSNHFAHCPFVIDPAQPQSGFCARDGFTMESHCEQCHRGSVRVAAVIEAAQAGAITNEAARELLEMPSFEGELTRSSSVPAQLAGADPRDSYDELAIEEHDEPCAHVLQGVDNHDECMLCGRTFGGEAG